MSENRKRTRIKCVVLGAAGAGKTSLVRRYFRGTFEGGRRVPTLGSDFYTGRVRIPTAAQEGFEEKDATRTTKDGDDLFISVQIWDTAGRERKAEYTADLSDDFFRNADGAMLVYDATSSTSFTQLLKWHADLMERMKHFDRKFPVLIVANKMDIIYERQRQNQQPERQKQLVPQRNVMRLPESFKGKDSRYEYHVGPSKEVTESKASKEIASTYMATHGEWTNDGNYLDSVLNSEDRSHPDRDMVLLWCLRNGLTHVEASALDGTGVQQVMESLVALALEDKRRDPEPVRNKHEEEFQSQLQEKFHANKTLDLQQRYASKEQGCWGFCDSCDGANSD